MNIGNKRLLKLADHLDTLQPQQLRMKAWVSKQNNEFLDIPNHKRESIVANIPKLTSECGFAACAIGHAGGIRSFRDRGFRLMYRFDGVVEPVFRSDRTYEGWAAVEKFFELDESNAEYLFHGNNYKSRVTPKTVANRLRKFVKNQTKEK